MRLVAAMFLLLVGCAPRRVPAPVVLRGPSYVDLAAGSRVVVITPVLKSGGFLLKKDGQEEAGNTITLRAGAEFQGYETAIYGVEQREKGGGVRVALREVSLNRGGRITHPAESIAPRFRFSGRLRYARLLFTLKVSDADHNMAVLAAADAGRLAALTARVQATPGTACRSGRYEYCEWIPAGVAVRPERPVGGGWAPAR